MATPTFFLKINFSQIKSESRRSSGDAHEKCGSTHGTHAHYTMPSTPQQNDVAERRNRTLMEMVRSMMSYSLVPISLWGEALKTAMYIS